MTNFEIIKDYLQKSETDIKSILILGSGSSLEFFHFINEKKIERIFYVDKFSIFRKMLDDIKPSIINGTNQEWDLYNKLNEPSVEGQYYQVFLYFCKKNAIRCEIEENIFLKKTKFYTLPIQEAFKEIDNQFDLIVISKVLSHIPDSEKNDSWILNEVKKYLSGTGIVFLKVNGKNYPTKSRDNAYITQPLRNYPINNLKELISNYKIVEGPKIIEVEDFEAEEYWTILTDEKE